MWKLRKLDVLSRVAQGFGDHHNSLARFISAVAPASCGVTAEITSLHTVETSLEPDKEFVLRDRPPFRIFQQLCLTTETPPNIGSGSDRLVTATTSEKTPSHDQHTEPLW